MALTRGTMTFAAAEPVIDNRIVGNTSSGGAPTTTGYGYGRTTGRRGLFVYSVGSNVGKITSLTKTLKATASTETSGNSVLAPITAQQELITESGSLGTVVDTGIPWTTLFSQTTGAASAAGHNTGTARSVQASKTATDLAGGAIDIIFNDADAVAVGNEAQRSILSRGLTGSARKIAMLLFFENESAASTREVTITARENTTYEGLPSLAFSGNLFPYGFGIKEDEIEVHKTPNSFKVRQVIGDYAYAAGDTIRVEWSLNSDMSSSTLTTALDATDYSEDDVLDILVQHNSPGVPIYYRIRHTVGTVAQAYNGETITVAAITEDDYEALPDDGIVAGSWSANRNGCAATEIAIRCATDVAMDADVDYAFILHGTTSGSLTSVSATVSMPAARRSAFKVLGTGVTKTNRQYYRLVIVKDGTFYRSAEYSVGPIKTTGNVPFLITSDLHAFSAWYNETGAIALSSIYNIPQTIRSQMRDQVFAAMLAEVGDDGLPVHFEINLGDDIQSKLQTTQAFPVDVEGTPSSPDTSRAKSQADMNYVTAACVRKNIVLRQIQRLVRLVGNHEGGHAFMYGKDWDGVIKSPEVVGRNTLDPEVDVAGWTIDAYQNYVGNPDGAGIYGGGDPLGRWGYIDIGDELRFIWLDPYLYSQLISGDPDDLPNSYDSKFSWTIGAQLDFLFNAATGVLRTSTRRINVIGTHNFTATRVAGGPNYYGWSWFDVASPKGNTPEGEHAGASDWVTADPYNLSAGSALEQEFQLVGLHRMTTKYRPDDSILEWLTGHVHYGVVERPHDGQGHISAPRPIGEYTEGGGGANFGKGHRLTDAGEISYSDDDTIFETSNGGYLRCDLDETSLRIRFRKFFRSDKFAGQFKPDGVTPINTAYFDAGAIQNAGPNEIETDEATQYDLRIALPEHPLESFSDSFGDDCVLEDTVSQVSAGTEQDPLDEYQANKRICSNTRAHWKNYTSGTGDNITYLAVRNSQIDSEVHLCTKRPFDAAHDYVTQGIRRMLASVNREITVDTRVGGNPSALIGLIQVCGGDIDPTFAGTAVGLGLYLRYDDVRASLSFDDGSTVEALTSTLTLSPSISDTMTEFRIVLRGSKVVFSAGGTVLASVTLTAAQRAWLDADSDRRWLGLAGRTNNVTNEGFNVEFRDFSAEDASRSAAGLSPLHPAHPMARMMRRCNRG